MKILFFGTPDIAVPYLEELLRAEEVVGVVTQPDKPSARGMLVSALPVKRVAVKNNMPVFQPAKFDEALAGRIRELKPEAGVVISYGCLIPEYIFQLPAFGCFNVHFSLLPKYRGAAPVQRALINGEVETGVTTFWIEKTLDTGPVLVQKKLSIGADDDAAALFEKLAPLGVEAMNETLQRLKKGECAGAAQSGEPTFAPSLKKDDGKIDWSASAERILNLIRGTRIWPGAYSFLETGEHSGKRVKILKARLAPDIAAGNNAANGEIVSVENKSSIAVKCGKGFLAIDEVHPESKNAVSAWNFWQGARLKIGDRFK